MKCFSVILRQPAAGVAAEVESVPDAMRSALSKLLFGIAPADIPARKLISRQNQTGIEG